MALIKGDRVIAALKPGADRPSDGGDLYLLPAATGDRHGWRFDYSFGGKRQTISLGVYPAVGLKLARERAQTAGAQVAAGLNPSTERKQQRAAEAGLRHNGQLRLLIVPLSTVRTSVVHLCASLGHRVSSSIEIRALVRKDISVKRASLTAGVKGMPAEELTEASPRPTRPPAPRPPPAP